MIKIENLHMILRNINRNRGKTLLVLIQIAFGFFIMLLGFSSIEKEYLHLNKTLLVNSKTIYKLYPNNKVQNENSSKLITNTFNENASSITKDIFEDVYNRIKDDSRILKIGRTLGNVILAEKDTNFIKCSTRNLLVLQMDETATTMFNRRLVSGTDFNAYYKSSHNDNYIPILIGEPLEKDNPIGSVFNLPALFNPATNKLYDFKVIGILDKTVPLKADDSETDTMGNHGYAVVMPQLLARNPVGSTIYNGLSIEFKHDKDAKIIENELNQKLDHSSILFQNVGKSANLMLDAAKNNAIAPIVYSIVILILSGFGVISSSFFTLKKRVNEFGIRMAIGATKLDIISLIVGELIFIYIVADLVALCCVYIIQLAFQEVKVDILVLASSFFITLLFMIISIIPILFKMKNQTPIEFRKN